MSHLRHSAKHSLCAAAIAVSCVAVAQASPVNTVYSAENALYGSGYAVGVADGWIDDALRTAISNYQSDTRGLKPSGNLDPATLSALGVESRPAGTISDNQVSDRSAALSVLGLNENDLPAATGTAEISSAPTVAETVSEPVPESEPQSEPELEPRTVSQVSQAAKAEQDEAKAAPTETANDNYEAASAPAQVRSGPIVASSDPRAALSPFPVPIAPISDEQVEAEPEPSPTQSQAVAEVRASESAKVSDSSDVASGLSAEAQTETDLASNASEDNGFELPEEPTAAGKATPKPDPVASAHAVQTNQAMSSRGFFSTLFDFLFGWII